MDFPNFTDYFRRGRNEALRRNRALALSAIERDGSDANILVASGAAMAEQVTAQLAVVESGLFLDSAKGQKLDRYVYDRYNMLRKPAASAVGSVQFSLPTPNPTAFPIPANTALQTGDGRRYLTTAASTFPAGSLGPISVPVVSALAGVKQQAGPGLITNLVSTLAGSPATLVVTNQLATAGAADREMDDSLKNRARKFWTTAQKGTRGALEADAAGVAGVVKAVANESVDTSGNPVRYVELVVADQFTDALIRQGITPPSYEAQAQSLARTVYNSLADTRVFGMPVVVRVAQQVLLPISLQLRYQAGADPLTVDLFARAIATAYTNELVPGQTWLHAELVTRLRSTPGLQWTGSEVLSPGGDVVPATSLQVLRTSMSLVQNSSQDGATGVGFFGV